MMWQLACDAWAFKGEPEHAQSDFRDMVSAFTAEGAEYLVTPDLVFQIGVEPNRIDILTTIDGVGFDEAWRDRIVAHIDALDVPVLSRRHMIANKRATGRPRDIADVAALEAEFG